VAVHTCVYASTRTIRRACPRCSIQRQLRSGIVPKAVGCIACKSPVCNAADHPRVARPRNAHGRSRTIRNNGTGSYATLVSRGPGIQWPRVRASNVARARRSVSYSRLSYGYTHRWIVFAVRMVTELFSPSPFPISVTHYPLENRHLSPWLSVVFPDPFPSWSRISLLVQRSPSRSLPPSLPPSLLLSRRSADNCAGLT